MAAMSKHETGTVTKQTTPVLNSSWLLLGGNSSGGIPHFVVPWEAGGPFPLKPARLSRTPQNTIHRCCVKHETTLLCPSTTKATVSKQRQTAESKHETHAGSKSRSTIGGVGDVANLSVLGENSTKIAAPGDIFDQPPGEMR